MFDIHYLYFAQGLGFISMFLAWWANAQRDDKALLSGNLIASGLTAIHLGLLGSPLGMVNQLLNMGRFFSSRYYRISILAPIFASLAIIQGFLWAEHWSEWCAVLAGVIMSFALIYCQGTQLRLSILVSNICNLTLSLHLHSWSGVIYQIITIGMMTYQLTTDTHYDKSGNEPTYNQALAK
ncbi:YgjV family protein [Shewanella woodyi]|uniref:YgjV family protein n=1 Tax=Shewanella woodyi TaxID=60961 RepID=UPI002165C7FA|nr:YgjV family protein [Shewanella woodyi]